MNPASLVTDAKDVRWANAMERKGLLKACLVPHVKRLMGENCFLFLGGDEKRRLRKVVEPAFTPAAIQSYASLIDTVVKEEL